MGNPRFVLCSTVVSVMIAKWLIFLGRLKQCEFGQRGDEHVETWKPQVYADVFSAFDNLTTSSVDDTFEFWLVQPA